MKLDKSLNSIIVRLKFKKAFDRIYFQKVSQFYYSSIKVIDYFQTNEKVSTVSILL